MVDPGQANSFASINLLSEGRPPALVLQIPPDGSNQPAGERFLGFPAKFTFELSGIDRVTMIMTRTVCDIRNMSIVRTTLRTQLIERRTDVLDYPEIRALISSAHVIGLTWLAVLQD
jgi:hypothetical protein